MFRLKGNLVFVLATVSIFFRKADANNIGIAFSGGGFKSVADQTAVTAGLLAELMRRDENLRKDDLTPSPLASSDLYKDVKSLSTISGGSWFTSYLVYSINFRQMVEKMAKEAASGAAKGTVSGIFYGEYGGRFDVLRSSKTTRNDIQRLFLALDEYEYVSRFVALPFLRMAVENIRNGLRTVLNFSQIGSDGGPLSSWFYVTKNILGDDINQMTLGSEVQEWSKGKSWNIITSATTVSGPSLIPIFPEVSNIWADGIDGAFNSKLSYSTRGEKLPKLPYFVPVLFSVVLGNEGSPPAPLPESVYSVTEKLQLTYYGRKRRNWLNWLLPNEFSKTIKPGIQPTRNANKSFADMPIVGPVAASSAAIGFASILPDEITGLLTQILQLNPAVGFACKGKDPSALFSTGQDLIDKLWNKNDALTRKDFDAVTNNGVCNFLDGGGSDPFGIATALASGANQIFCVNAIPDIATVQRYHFGDIPLPFHIFENGTATHGEEQEFDKTADGTVENMKFQKVTVKTVKNIYFGIEEGREVTLYVFSAQSKKLSTGDIVAGTVNTFKDIGEYIEGMMATFALSSNKAIVDKMLMALGALRGGINHHK